MSSGGAMRTPPFDEFRDQLLAHLGRGALWSLLMLHLLRQQLRTHVRWGSADHFIPALIMRNMYSSGVSLFCADPTNASKAMIVRSRGIITAPCPFEWRSRMATTFATTRWTGAMFGRVSRA
jgi:hypothetical protein